jgi:hypothetical protein
MSSDAKEQVFLPADDLFHPIGSADPALTETIWWNFYVPEWHIDAEIYLCFRRNLGVSYAGIYVWDSFCKHFTDTRYFDTRSYLPLPATDLDDFQLANQLKMRARVPLQHYEIEYRGARGNGFSLEFDALAPPVGFLPVHQDADRAAFAPGHFDQVGRMHGELYLDGTMIMVDCITQRDRSWGATRKEDLGYPPDVDWHSAHFGNDLWLQCWLWHGEPISNDLQSGMVYKSGRPVRLESAERLTTLDSSGVEARSIDLRLRDVEGDEYLLQGTVRNMFPWPGWFNMVGFAGLVEWNWDGRVGWGEVHDGRTVDATIARKRSRKIGRDEEHREC